MDKSSEFKFDVDNELLGNMPFVHQITKESTVSELFEMFGPAFQMEAIYDPR